MFRVLTEYCSAYELYADLKRHSKTGYDVEKSAQFFKNTFCQENVKIHFLGAWCVRPVTLIRRHSNMYVIRDTVSSVGVVRGKNLPGTASFNNSVCYFRHALAMDEQRVKFLPEYICGGESYAEQVRVKNCSFSHI